MIPSAKPLSEYTVQYETDPKIDSGIRLIDEAINPVFTETFKADPANSVNPLYVHTSIAGIIWILGIAILLLCSLISHFRLKKRLNDSIPLSEEIRLCDHIETPFVYGLFQPMIYLPSSLNEKDRKIVLKHERMHIARRDHLLKPLAYLISIVHWFNPLVWLSYHLFCKDIEIACDEAVIKDMTLQEKKDYSKTLLSCAAHKRFVFSYPLAFGEVGIKERVKNVLDYKKPSFWIILAGIVICIVTGVCFLTNPKHNPDASYLLEKCGSFDLAYPKDIDLKQKEASKVDSYRENYVFACYDDAAAYERNFLFSEEEDCVFTMELIYADLAQGDDIKKYASDMRASLMNHDRIWTLQSVIEEKDDSVIFKAAPYRKEIEDHGVIYCRYFLKDDGVGFARIIVREEADDKYGKIIESILKKLK